LEKVTGLLFIDVPIWVCPEKKEGNIRDEFG
jgi:hypothetical protein